MASLVKSPVDTIKVDDQRALPFGLTIKVGSGFQKEVVPVSALTTSPQRVEAYVYEITELRDVAIELETNVDVTVNVKWDVVAPFDVEEKYYEAFTLTREAPQKLLFHHSGGREYPWRCGMYWFELEYEQRSYLGAFRIVPKNMDERQLRQMHQLLNRYLEGFLLDSHAFQRSLGSPHYHEQLFYWRFYFWMRTKGNTLFTSLHYIEQNAKVHLQKQYHVESRPGRIDQRSLRWELSKGQRYDAGKSYNPWMMEEWDHQDNRMAKFQALQIAKKLDECEYQIREINEQLRVAWEKASQECRAMEKRISRLRNNPKTTQRSVQRHYGQLTGQRAELQKLAYQRERLTVPKNRLLKYKQQLLACLNTPFWQSVRSYPDNKASLSSGVGYQTVHQLWKESQAIVDMQTREQEVSVPAHKPTHLLYEYFVYFVVVECFEALGFHRSDHGSRQAFLAALSQQGLTEGFTLSLQCEDDLVKVVYEEAIEPDEYSAAQKKTYFYSGGVHRKPDIRVDRYVSTEDGWRYESSIILEVKYSPLGNIVHLDGQGDTRAMEQMNDYGNIRYKYPGGGYAHRPIHAVFCVYPGDDRQEILFPMSYGMMLQLYPDPSNESGEAIVGKEAFMQQLEQYLGRG